MTDAIRWPQRLRWFYFLLLPCLLSCASGTPPGRSRELLNHDDVQIDVLVEGRGPAIVMLPSSRRDTLDFDAVAARIAAAGFRVLRPQTRGTGRSVGPMQGLDLNILASDVTWVVDQLGGGRAILVGHAYGHFIARVADLNTPDKVRGVVVLGGAAKVFPAGLAGKLAVAADPQQPREERLKNLQAAFFAPGNDASPWLEGWYPQLTAIYAKAGQTPDKNLWWPVSHAPVLDLQGADDPWRPAATRNELKDVLGDKVTVRVIANASHALIPEQPAAVADAIVEWAKTLKP